MKIFNLFCIFLLACLCSAHYIADNDVNKAITKREEYNMLNLWSDVCGVFDLFESKKKNGKVAKLLKKANLMCAIGDFVLSVGAAVELIPRGQCRYPRGQCRYPLINNYGTTEVCSQGPNRLYGEWRNVSVYGCYHLGKGGTNSFTKCCVINANYEVSIQKKMYSGPSSGVENVDGFKWLNYPQCSYRTYLLNQQCSKNVNTATCDNLAERAITECQAHPN